MKKILAALALMLPVSGFCQDQPHYTMFMYNKLVYNPGYAGSRNVLSINGAYRNQWSGIDGAPKNMNLSIDAPIGKAYSEEFHHVALGLMLNRETQGPVSNTNISATYAYRIKLEKSMLSMGLQAGVALYNANYSELTPQDVTDEQLQYDVKNAVLPNFGFGAFWSSKRFYLGLSVPNLLENYYDKKQKDYTSGKKARQIRGYYLSGGYTIPVSEHFALQPQVLLRYNADGAYKLPMNADINLSGIFYQRFMLGATYRTDKSIEGIVHIQVAKKFNIGYAYDYSTSDLGPYTKGAHEISIGFDFLRDLNDYMDPRFIQNY